MTDIEGFLTIYGHSDNLLNNKKKYITYILRDISRCDVVEAIFGCDWNFSVERCRQRLEGGRQEIATFGFGSQIRSFM